MPHPRTIDLRSDTVTHPTPAMREAMAHAEVGDDVYGEDPTINRLEILAAEVVGTEAALFVPSGAMGNAIAIMTHCRRGEEVIAGHLSHIYQYEVGGAARLNGSPLHAVQNLPDGTLDRDLLVAALAHGDDIHETRAGLLCLENTQNMCGGRILTPATMRELTTPARERGIPVHLDGARLFNAAVGAGIPAREIVAEADSVMFCLSKGLSAPVGSMVAGTANFIAQARRVRKLLGGGMRQAGILAAAGIIALTEMVDRLAEDHANARQFAELLLATGRIEVDPTVVETDIVFFRVTGGGTRDAEQLAEAAGREGVLIGSFPDGRIRAITHYGITADDIAHAAQVIARCLE